MFTGFSASYDRIVDGVYHQTYDRVILPIKVPAYPHTPGAVQPGTYRDMVEQYRFDEQYRGFTLEGVPRFATACAVPAAVIQIVSRRPSGIRTFWV